ncbi:MAG: RNA-binding protein [Actinomycetia bacterium]|nr:RNA-binding protein [Actinomycetes bacterium]
MRLLVRNLSRSTTEDQLRALFEAIGPVQSCTIVMDAETKQSKGFGFVTMPKAGHAKAAVAQLNRAILDGATIRVKKAQ